MKLSGAKRQLSVSPWPEATAPGHQKNSTLKVQILDFDRRFYFRLIKDQ